MKKCAVLTCMVAALSVFGGGLTAEIDKKHSISIKGDHVVISALTELNAVIPPWRGERFNNADVCEVTREGNKVIARQVESNRTKVFQVHEFSCAIDGNKALVTLSAELKEDLPTSMHYKALIIPDYLLAGAEYTVILENGDTQTGVIPPEIEDPTFLGELIKNFREGTFTSYYGTLKVRVLDGSPNLHLYECRADSPYNRIRGFEIGSRWDVTFGELVEHKLEVEFDGVELTPAQPLPVVKSPKLPVTKDAQIFTPQRADYSSVPAPRSVEMTGSAIFAARSGVQLSISGANDADTARLVAAARRILKYDFPNLDVDFDKRNASVPGISIFVTDAAPAPENPEGYAFEVTADEVKIFSRTARGAFFALHQFNMMVKDGGVAAMKVVDYPDYEYRGIHLLLDEDSVRVSGAMIEHLFAPLKINSLVVECQYVKWDSTKPLHQNWAMTKEQVRQLKQIADDNFMEFTPLFQTLGHCYWLFANKQNIEMAENPRDPYAYNPSHPDVYPLMDATLAEILDVFEPSTLHIGHDEVCNPEREWPTQPENVAKGAAQVFYDDIMHYYEFAQKNNLKVMMWHDMLLTSEECPENGAGGGERNIHKVRDILPKDISIVFWRYSAGFPFTDIDLMYDLGFHDLIGATWYDRQNIVDICQYGRGKLRGMLQTTWIGYNGNANAVQLQFMQMHPYAQLALSSWNSELTLAETDTAKIFCDLMEPSREQTPLAGAMLDLTDWVNVNMNPEVNVFLAESLFGLDTLDAGSVVHAGGMKFQLSNRDGHAGAVTVKSRVAPDFPAKSAEIKLNITAGKLNFLHSTINSSGNFEQVIGNYIITYADGTSVTAPIRYGMDIGSLACEVNFDLAPLRAVEWIHGERIQRMWYQTWVNPAPEKKIASVRLETATGEIPLYLFSINVTD